MEDPSEEDLKQLTDSLLGIGLISRCLAMLERMQSQYEKEGCESAAKLIQAGKSKLMHTARLASLEDSASDPPSSGGSSTNEPSPISSIPSSTELSEPTETGSNGEMPTLPRKRGRPRKNPEQAS